MGTTKSGRHHYKCEFRLYNSSGNLTYENVEHKFTAINGIEHITRNVKRYAAHGMTAVFANVVDLDKDTK